jgi:hypothetical protein
MSDVRLKLPFAISYMAARFQTETVPMWPMSVGRHREKAGTLTTVDASLSLLGRATLVARSSHAHLDREPPQGEVYFTRIAHERVARSDLRVETLAVQP